MHTVNRIWQHFSGLWYSSKMYIVLWGQRILSERKKKEEKVLFSLEFHFAAPKWVPAHPLSAITSEIQMPATLSESKLFQGLWILVQMWIICDGVGSKGAVKISLMRKKLVLVCLWLQLQ